MFSDWQGIFYDELSAKVSEVGSKFVKLASLNSNVKELKVKSNIRLKGSPKVQSSSKTGLRLKKPPRQETTL